RRRPRKIQTDCGTVTAVHSHLNIESSWTQRCGNQQIDLRGRDVINVRVDETDNDADARAAQSSRQHMAAQVFGAYGAGGKSKVSTVERNDGIRRDRAGLIARRINYAGCGVGRRRYSSASLGRKCRPVK